MFEVQTKQITAANNGGEFTYTFNDNVYSYVSGVTAFYFHYDSHDHDIKNFYVQLSEVNKYANNLTLKANFGMNDNSGHSLSSNSYIDVTVLAMTKQSDSSILFDTVMDLQNNQTSQAIQPSFETTYGQQVSLQGFNLSFGSTDQRVHQLEAATSLVSEGGNTVAVNSTAIMNEKSGGENQSTNSIDACVLINGDHSAGLLFKAEQAQTTSPQTFADESCNWAMFVQGFNLRYSSGQKHHVRSVTLDTDCTPSNGQVTWHAKALWHDDSHNDQKDYSPSTTDGSCVNVVFVGWPKSPS